MVNVCYYIYNFSGSNNHHIILGGIMSFESLQRAIKINENILKQCKSPHKRDIARMRLAIIRKHKKEIE